MMPPNDVLIAPHSCKGSQLAHSWASRGRNALATCFLDGRSNNTGEASFSELAQETGLGIEEIMEAAGGGDQEKGFRLFLASCRTIAESQGNPEFLRLGEEAVNSIRAEKPSGAAS